MANTDYESALGLVYTVGTKKNDRTGTGVRTQFGIDIRYDLNDGFPLITTKKIFFKGVVHELLWMISGDTNIKYLNDHGVHIWDQWADSTGDLGPVYGHQWRHWNVMDGGGEDYIDQLDTVIREIKRNPDSRRLIVNSWNVGELTAMRLPPCHMMFQFYVSDNKLSCKLTQRSADMFLGVPFNIASYALLTHMVAEVCGLGVGELIWSGGDCHIYENHITQVETQLARTESAYEFPRIELTHRDNIEDFTYEDVHLINYESHPSIKADVAV